MMPGSSQLCADRASCKRSAKQPSQPPVQHAHPTATTSSSVARKRGQGPARQTTEAPGLKRNSNQGTFFVNLQRVRAALEKRCLQDSLSAIASMHYAGHELPGSCIVSLVRLGEDAGNCSKTTSLELLRKLPSGVLNCENFVNLAQYVTNSSEPALVAQVHSLAIEAGFAFFPAACDALLRGYASSGHPNGADAFDQLLAQQCASTSGGPWQPTLTTLATAVAFCAEQRAVGLADHLVAYARTQWGVVPLQMYASLIKVYGQARLWSEACSLYDIIKHEGLTPDAAVYGALIKAAVESGRPDLAKQWFEESSNPDVVNYMSMIRAAGRQKDLAKALQLLDEVERSGWATDIAVYNCTLEACAAAQDMASAEKLLRRMERAELVDVVSYNTFLKVLLAQGAHGKAQGVLRSMRARGIQPNVVTYNSMVREAAARQDMDKAWWLAEEMLSKGVSPDAFTCSILAAGIKHKPTGKAMDSIMSLMQRADVVPDEVLLNCLLDVCVRLRDSERLTQILELRHVKGNVPSKGLCSTLLRAYGHSNQLDQAWALWRSLKEKGPDEEVFMSMVDACLASSDLPAAVQVFGEARVWLGAMPRATVAFSLVVKAAMQANKLHLAMDLYKETKGSIIFGVATFNALIDALVRGNRLQQARTLFKDMALQNVLPDLITYSILIKGYAAGGDLETAITLLGQMQRSGIAPDAVLFNSILHGCAQSQRRTLTEHVLADMETAGIAPSNFTLSILVKLYGRCGDLKAAMEVLETYPVKYGFSLNAQVYTCLMSACISSAELPRAFDVYQKMVNAGCKADAKTYQTLLVGCLKHGDAELAAQIVADAMKGEAARSSSNPVLGKDMLESAIMLCHRRKKPLLWAAITEHMKAAGMAVSSRVLAVTERQAAGLHKLQARQSE
eukprot:TRINITY_DN12467_c0_g1_i1.p1 TRINITY_DN12467_c0_g1~~TRINITY_DN12467_c0_g1_i1.p1  ORF type:complete len:904 (-),score=181.27 TRINITY_DN12467_c0_g1_i1:163-2874(-)